MKILASIQKELFAFKISVLKKFHNIHRETPVLESPFNKVAGLMA